MIQQQSYEESVDTYALAEFDVRAIVEENGPLFGAIVDTAPAYAMPNADMLATINRVLTDRPDMLRTIVARGTWLSAQELARLSRVALADLARQIIAATQDAFAAGVLKTIVRDELKPFSAYLSGVRH